jgi:exopolysaccharide biosynthesis polyprenyl glycosylphosphotransferase
MQLRLPWLRERLQLFSLAAADAALLSFFYNLSYWQRLGIWEGLNRALMAFLVLWLGGSYLLGRYSRVSAVDGAWQRRRWLGTVLVAFGVLALVLAHTWVFRVIDAPTRYRGFLAPMLAATALCSGLVQGLVCRRPGLQRPWLLVATAGELEVVRQELAQEPENGARVCLWELEQLQACNTKELAGFAAVALSDRLLLQAVQLEILLRHRSEGLVVSSLVNWAELILQRVPPELLSREALLRSEGFALQPGRLGWRLKRAGDLLVASLLLVATLPLMALAALLIWLEDRGPVLYSQERSGLFGEPYRVFKLRSMGTDAEAGGLRWASLGDRRITRVGAWLRKLRIDELPQLLAVLSGEMSLIGPRPERPELEFTLEEQIPHYRVRHWLRPGLSGWAQVCYPYGASLADSRAKLAYDLYYLRNANLLLDLLILFKTIKLVAGARGAQPKGLAAEPPSVVV